MDKSETGADAVRLEHCPDCDATMVYPVSWRETEDDCWEIELRCPNCEWCVRGVYRHADVEKYDHVLNRATDRLIDDLHLLSAQNMREYVARFVALLRKDLLLPEDF